MALEGREQWTSLGAVQTPLWKPTCQQPMITPHQPMADIPSLKAPPREVGDVTYGAELKVVWGHASSQTSSFYTEFWFWRRCCPSDTHFLLWTVFNISVPLLKAHGKVVIISSVMRKCSGHSWLLQGHILIIWAKWETLTKWFPGPSLPEKMQIYQNKNLMYVFIYLFFTLKIPSMSKYSISHPGGEKKTLISQKLGLSWVLWWCKHAEGYMANWPCLEVWEAVPTTGNDPALVCWTDSAPLTVKNWPWAGWPSLATAAALVRPHQLRHRWFP